MIVTGCGDRARVTGAAAVGGGDQLAHVGSVVVPDCEATVAVSVMSCPGAPEVGLAVRMVVLDGSGEPH